MDTKYIGFIRAINVGGHSMVKMQHIKNIFEQMGAHDVITYLQSGNVVFYSSEKNINVLSDKFKLAWENTLSNENVEKKIPDIFIFTRTDIEKKIENIPFGQDILQQGNKVFMALLHKNPENPDVSRMTAKAENAEIFSIADHCMYLFYPQGLGNSKLNNAIIEKALGMSTTLRNLNTLKALLLL